MRPRGSPFVVSAILLVGGVLLTGCVGGPSPTDSGVQGRTLVDGGCPAVRADTPCANLPLAAKIIVRRNSTDQVVTTIETEKDGEFRIALAPGEYVVHPVSMTDTILPRADDVKITLETSKYQDITIVFDSGVRGPTETG